MAIENSIKHIRSQCGVVLYRWSTEELSFSGSSLDLLSDSDAIDISSRILELNYHNNMGGAGGFSFRLPNNTGLRSSNDWKEIIKPGHWIAVYLSQDGDLPLSTEVNSPERPYPRDKIRCIGYVERVSVQTTTNDRGAFDAQYEVSGRDFAIVYEETTIWHDLFMFDQNALNAAIGSLAVTADTSLDAQMRTVHTLFYAPQQLLPRDDDGDASLTSIGKQWLLPKRLVRDLGLNIPTSEPTYWGNIRETLNFSNTLMNVPVNNPIDFLSGNAWTKLKEISVPAFHELYTEINDDGCPELVFRPIPWKFDDSRYPTVARTILGFQNLSRVEVPAVDVTAVDLGQDSLNRKNHFLTTVKTALFGVTDNISVLQGSRFPLENRDSVRRHGFRPMHTDINSLTLNRALNNGAPNRNLLVEYSELLLDYWSNAIFLESGAVQKIGTNDIKLGKTLLFNDDVPYVARKLFYIEGYADTFIVDDQGTGTWSQSIELTRGADLQDYANRFGLRARNTDFEQSGEFTRA